MKLSIIIPVYNTEKYIKKCLSSIIEQNRNDIEIIIIDDKSTDNSLKIIKETTKNIKNVTILENEENKGISYSRNVGLNISKGEYIYFIDSDDYLNKNSLNIILNNLDADILKISYNRKIGIYNKPMLLCSKEYNIEDNKNQLYQEDCFVWNKIFRRELIKNNRFEEKMKYEDLPFISIALVNAPKIKNISNILYNYRMNVGSVTFKDRYIPNNSILDIFKANQILDEEMIKANLYEEYREILNDLHIYHAFGSVMNCAFWFKINEQERSVLVNSIISYIKKIYHVDNLYDVILIKNRYESNKLYMMRVKYIKSLLKYGWQNIEIDDIEDIKKLILSN